MSEGDKVDQHVLIQNVLFSCVRVFVRQMLDQHLRVHILNCVWRRTTTIATTNDAMQINNRQIQNTDNMSCMLKWESLGSDDEPLIV